MKHIQSHRKTLGFASLALVSVFDLSGCVTHYSDYYDDDYYPAHRTVVVKHTAPVYHRVEVYEREPTVITSPSRPTHYNPFNRPNEPAVLYQRPHHYSDETVIVNPGRHQQQVIRVRPRHSYQEAQTTVIKGYRPHNKETHIVHSTDSTEVKQPKKIVIDNRQGDAPPSNLAE